MGLPFFVYTKYFDKKGIIFLFLCKKITWLNPQSDNIQTKNSNGVSIHIENVRKKKYQRWSKEKIAIHLCS